MKKLNRGDKIYLDPENKKESLVNEYLSCRDGIVECVEYNDCSGYGNRVRLFLCRDTKHESISIVRQTMVYNKWCEESLSFDLDSFKFFENLISGKAEEESKDLGGKYTLVRDY